VGTAAARKTAAESAAPVAKRPQPHGGALLPGGKPGNKGGPGRPPLAFKAFAAALAASPEFQARLQQSALAGDIQAAKLVIQYAEGLPPQTVQVTMSQDEARARLQAIADRAEGREKAP
jgi:hypothetical protein